MRNLLLVCAYARAREKRGILVFLQFKIQPCQLLNLRCANWSVDASKCFSKTTRHFMKSDVLFYEKRRVVLWKVTCCFMGNDVLFMQDNILVLQLDRYSTTRNWKDNFLSSFIFLLAYCFSFVLAVAHYAFELTVNNLLNNGMKSVRELMTDWG